MEKLAFFYLASWKFEDLKRKRKRIVQHFLFVTTCMYTDDRSKQSLTSTSKKRHFLPHIWAILNVLRKNYALLPKRVSIYTNRNFYNTRAKTEKMFVAQRN